MSIDNPAVVKPSNTSQWRRLVPLGAASPSSDTSRYFLGPSVPIRLLFSSLEYHHLGKPLYDAELRLGRYGVHCLQVSASTRKSW